MIVSVAGKNAGFSLGQKSVKEVTVPKTYLSLFQQLPKELK